MKTNFFNIPGIEEQFNEVVKSSGVNYGINQSIGGHYRLVAYRDDEWMNGNTQAYDIIFEDPASEDLYDRENAMSIFIDVIKERHNL